jgi:hypothetical protein
MAKRRKTKPVSNAKWIQRNFANLVDKYPGKYAIVADGDVFVGYDPIVLEQEALQKHPGANLTGFPIPRPEDFQCAL